VSRLFLVTGGGGFIGSHIVRALVKRGERVRVLDDLSGCKSLKRLQGLGDGAELIVGSIDDPVVLDKSLRGVETVFHQAALVSVPESVVNPMAYHQTDATATLGLLEACRRAGTKRLIYASTSAIYGEAPEQPKIETMRGLPISPYGIAKFAGELYVSAYAKLHGLQTISLRYFNVFGSWQDPKSQYGAAIPSIISRLLTGISPTIYGDGEQTRDFCHVDNVVHANLLAADTGNLQGEIVNIGCGKRTSINRIVQLANELLGTSIRSIFMPQRVGDVRDSLADISTAKTVLGYEPVREFEEGLRRSIDWYSKN
jgi:UDP-glucose 4-epimerase